MIDVLTRDYFSISDDVHEGMDEVCWRVPAQWLEGNRHDVAPEGLFGEQTVLVWCVFVAH